VSGDAGAIYAVKDKQNQSKLGNLLNSIINYLLHKQISTPEKDTEVHENKAVFDIKDKDFVDSNKEEMKVLKQYKELEEKNVVMKEAALKETIVRENALKETILRKNALKEAAFRETVLKEAALKEAALKEEFAREREILEQSHARALEQFALKEVLTRDHEVQHLNESVGREIKATFRENEPDLKSSRLIQIDQGGSSVLITQQGKLNIIPTGITSFDPIIMGGFPAGSLVLMIADAGAGNTEFAYTSAANLFWLKNDQARYNSISNQLQGYLVKEGNLKIPDSICYISLAHSKDDIFKELRYAFPPDFIKYWNGKSFFFKDFSSFSALTPTMEYEKDWTSTKGLKGDGKLSLLRELISTLEFQAPNSLVIIDSLNRLIKACGFEWNDCLSFLEDLQKKSKKWDGLVYLLMGKGIIENPKEEEIMDIADGVMAFKWKEDGFVNQQTMQIIKFRGLMPRMAKENIVRFDISVTNIDGFAVTNVKRISGRR